MKMSGNPAMSSSSSGKGGAGKSASGGKMQLSSEMEETIKRIQVEIPIILRFLLETNQLTKE